MSLRRVVSEVKAQWGALQSRASMCGGYRQFIRGEGGAIAIYFGLSALVFVGVAGLAVDAARGYLVKAKLSEAIDAAALAGGKALQTANDPDGNKVKTDALAFFNANFPSGAMGANVTTPAISIDANKTYVTVTSNATIPTTLMSVLGFKNMTMTAAAKVARAQSGLDVVFSFDVSGSMGSPPSKIASLKSNASALVDSLFKPFTSGGQQQFVTVGGTQYSFLNIGVVPWNAKVNVLTYPATSPGTVDGPTGGSFTDPRGGGGTLAGVYKAANSEVPLLLNAGSSSAVPGGWKGCVYARYSDNGSESDDADTTLGLTTGNWKGWEPVPTSEGEGSSGFFNCYSSYWNNNQNAPTGFFSSKSAPAYWPSLPASLRHNEDCSDCPAIGILPLQSSATPVKNMINALVAGGNTDAPQGLFWGWEVLMPGEPFSEAKVDPPFQRAQAIVFMTDGQNYGGNGDAYHGWFGSGENAGTLTSKGNITMPDGTQVKNNLNNHLLQLAAKIKGTDPLAGDAVKIYVIQYQESGSGLTALLQAVATQPQAPYYYFAPDSASLNSIFDQIAASLSALRLVQ